MRIVVLARHDVAGSWFHLAGVLRERGLADIRVVTFAHDPARGWPVDIADVYDGGQELRHLLQHADAFHLVDMLPEDVEVFDGLVARRCAEGSVQVSLQVDERPAPMHARHIAKLAEHHGWSLVATRPNMVPGAEFIAPFMPLWRAAWQPVAVGTSARTRSPERIVFASCATRLRDEPRLESMIERAEVAAAGLPDVRVEVLSGRTHHTTLQRRRRSHLVLDGDDGIGRTTLEALAQGIATVTELSAADHEAWTALAGAPPPVIPAFALEGAMTELAGVLEPDPALRRWAMAAANPERWLQRAAAMWSQGGAEERAA